ncbi:angiopoietin-related protein 4 isoform X2 [Amblyraja radiata]|uniref:angiopoietin-related protein 4 isoform X2 n=1 Tax=Amblyraja radiata TaxID=386614 RepID=UPI0014039397|nr:angiopoietin-related protein 4 isoform X2 [Amblyraja radiata]
MKLALGGALCIALYAASCSRAMGNHLGDRKGSSAKERRMQFASWDEVNLIAHGLLQLGHGLKQHVDRTRDQLRGVTEQLRAHNLTLGELGETRLLQAGLLRDKVEEMGRDRLRMDQALQSLQEKVGRLASGRGEESTGLDNDNSIRSIMETQSKNIDELLTRIKDQQWQLDKQNIQIKVLQSKLQESRLHLKDSPSWKLILKRRMDIFPHPHPSDEPTLADKGGWTVIQRRMDGSIDFDRLWQAYKDGFGNLTGEFWLGLEKLYTIVRQGSYLLRIELEDWENHTEYTEYPFSLGSEATDYTITLKNPVSGNLKNAISESSGLRFSTRDQDHDLQFNMNCAKHLTGGWWFTTCGQANLNGKYFASKPQQRRERKRGIFWKSWRGRTYPLKTTTMMIRPVELEA